MSTYFSDVLSCFQCTRSFCFVQHFVQHNFLLNGQIGSGLLEQLRCSLSGHRIYLESASKSSVRCTERKYTFSPYLTRLTAFIFLFHLLLNDLAIFESETRKKFIHHLYHLLLHWPHHLLDHHLHHLSTLLPARSYPHQTRLRS